MESIIAKRNLFALSVALALVLLLLPSVLAGDQEKQIVLSVMKYQPTPAEPGNFIDVYLLVANPREAVTDFTVTFEDSYPFRLSEDDAATRTFKSIPETEDVVIKYRVFVDLDARNQEYNLTWKYQYNDQSGIYAFESPVTVQATDASLTIDHYDITPHPVAPGSNASLSIELKNNGRLTIKDIDVNLDTASSTAFSSFGTGNVQRIKSMGPGDVAQVSYQLISDPKAEAKIYSFPVSLTFRDERNNKYNSSSRVSLKSNAEPSLLASIQDSKLTAVNQSGAVTFKIVNNGAVDLKFLTLRLEPSPEYEILSTSSTDYLGNLDADDFESAEFTVKSKVKSPFFLLSVDFSDPYNTKFTREFKVPLKIVDALAGTTSLLKQVLMALVIIAIAVVLWLLRSRIVKLFKPSKR